MSLSAPLTGTETSSVGDLEPEKKDVGGHYFSRYSLSIYIKLHSFCVCVCVLSNILLAVIGQ